MRQRILIVDDENAILQLLATAFSDRYDIDIAPSGRSALSLFERDKYKVVISDQAMPLMTGVDMLEQMRVKDDHVQFVMISGHPMSEDAQAKASRIGVHAHIEKPFELVMLESKVVECIDIYENRHSTTGTDRTAKL